MMLRKLHFVHDGMFSCESRTVDKLEFPFLIFTLTSTEERENSKKLVLIALLKLT